MSVRSLLSPCTALLICGLLSAPVQARTARAASLPSGADLLIRMVGAQSRANTFHQVTHLTLVRGKGATTLVEQLQADATLKPQRFHGVAQMTQRSAGSMVPQASRAEEYIVKHAVAMTQDGKPWQCSTTDATHASLHANALAPTTLAGPLATALGTARTVRATTVSGTAAWDVHVKFSTTLAGTPVTSSVDYFIRQSDGELLKDKVSERVLGADQDVSETGTDVYSGYGKKVTIALPSACQA